MAVRKGHIHRVQRRFGTYYTATICVGYRLNRKCSYDLAEVTRWLADRLAESPTYGFANRCGGSSEAAPATPADEWDIARRHVTGPNPFAGARLVTSEAPSLWMVAAETNPLTARYHFRLKADWPRPHKVLCHDFLAEAPVSWIADDNGGEGYGSEEGARAAALAMSHDPSVALTVRPLSRRWRGCGADDTETD